MMQNKLYGSVASQFLDLCPCCVTFIEESVFVIGCYELNEQTKMVVGQLKSFHISENNELEEKSQVQCPGVLDMKYLRSLGLLVVCDVESNIHFYKCDTDNHYELNHVKSTSLNEHPQNLKQEHLKNLYLSCYVADEQRNNTIQVCVGTDTGTTIMMVYDESLDEVEATFLYTHQFSVWSTHIESSNTFYTGSDDQSLIKYDRRVQDMVVHQNKKSHSMGVSYITGALLTASFDEYIRVWDVAMLQKPLQEYKRPGGVWRIQQHNKQLLNAIFAENLYEIVELDDLGCTLIQSLEGHKSLAYGCEWSPSFTKILTLSFYDKNIQLWNI